MDHEQRWTRPAALIVVAVVAVLVAGCSGSGSDTSDEGARSDPAVDDGGTIEVLAYNVAGLPAEISKVRPDVNIPLISPLLDDFDIVATQEDFDWWKPDGLASTTDFVNYHGRLWAETTYEHRTDVHPGAEAVGIAPGDRPEQELGDGLAVGSRFPLSEVTRVPWDDCFGGLDTSDGGAADCLAMKGFLFTRVTLADGVEVDLYDLHAEAGGTETDQDLQAEQFDQLAAFIAANSEGRAVIVAGDTNLHTDRTDPDDLDVADAGIWDGLLEAEDLTDACAPTDCPEPGRIDKVAYRSGEGVDLEATAHRFRTDLFVDDDGEPLSDHDALHVSFAWSPA